MRHFTLLAIAAIMLAACNKPETVKTGAEQLLDRLQALQQKGYMYGHQDDPFYGLTWDGDTMPGVERSDVLETVGDYPAVMGFDLGGIELADSQNLDRATYFFIYSVSSLFKVV